MRSLMLIAAIGLIGCSAPGGLGSDPESQARALQRHAQRSAGPIEDGAQSDPTHLASLLMNSRERVRPFRAAAARRRAARERTVALREREELAKQQAAGTASAIAASTRDPEDGDEDKGDSLELRFLGDSLPVVLDMLARKANMSLSIPNDLGDKTVDVSFRSITPQEAIKAILADHDRKLARDGEVWRVVPEVREIALESRTHRLASAKTIDGEQVKSLLSVRGTFSLDTTGQILVVRDVPERLEAVEAYVEMVDRRKPQVMLEMIIVEVRSDADLGWGAIVNANRIRGGDVSARFSRQGGLPTNTGSQPFEIGLFDPGTDFEIFLNTRDDRTRLSVLSSPLLAAVSGTSAVLDLTEKIPYVESTNSTTVDGGAAINTSQQTQFEEAGIKLNATPVVGGDGVVEMTLVPEVLELVDFSFGTPVIDKRSVQTTVYVPDGETLVIGGLLRQSSNYSVDKVPVLGDIPYLRWLFRTETSTSSRRELLIFVTPHIIDGGIDVDRLSGLERPRQRANARELGFPGIERSLQKDPGHEPLREDPDGLGPREILPR